MQVAVVHQLGTQRASFRSGRQNREQLEIEAIAAIADGARLAGHDVMVCEADRHLIRSLDEFFCAGPRTRPDGVVLNLSYGIQGLSRQSHVPSILEMCGIPYVGSDPLTQGILLDKRLTKQLLTSVGLPTPRSPTEESLVTIRDSLPYPMLVKPQSESFSLDVAVVSTIDDLNEARARLSIDYGKAVLIEEYLPGREFNVSLLGDADVEMLPPVEVVFPGPEPHIYTTDDKLQHRPGRAYGVCPAAISKELTASLQTMAMDAFHALHCRDFARVDFRIDASERPVILEVNGLPSLHYFVLRACCLARRNVAQ